MKTHLDLYRADRLKAALTLKKLTRIEVAKRAKICVKTLYNVLCGFDIPVSKLRNVAEVLDVDPQLLFEPIPRAALMARALIEAEADAERVGSHRGNSTVAR